MVARLLNQILVQSEKSRRNAYNSNSIATDSKRNVKTRSMLEKLCISMTEKSANAILVKEKLSKRRPQPSIECMIVALV